MRALIVDVEPALSLSNTSLVLDMFVDHFYSDPHFGHANIIKYCNRPFADVDQMATAMIAIYNDVVSPEQTVLWCGDAFFCNMGRAQAIMQALNGKKIIVLGNHDQKPASMLKMGFDAVSKDSVVLEAAGRRFRARHYPYAEDVGVGDERYADRLSQRVEGETLIHGHTHDTRKTTPGAIHVGVDAWNYAPVSVAQLLEVSS